jgi:hypothetical protein
MDSEWCIGSSRVGDSPRIIDAKSGAWIADVCDEEMAAHIVETHNKAIRSTDSGEAK